MNPNERREYLTAIAEIPAKHRAWIESDDIALFSYYGLGIMLNDAQEAALNEVIRWPEGSIHLWRWANRTGKTTGLVILHAWAAWKKWRYVNEDKKAYDHFKYRTLHSSPLNRLNGKAWEMADAFLAGSAWQQLSAVTNRPRTPHLAAFFNTHSGRAKDGSDVLELHCLNNSVVDFLSTQGGAGRLESETWWLIGWDEFARQQPVDDVPLLFDQTFLARTSDHMAPFIMSSTVTDDAEPVYQELEDFASESPKDWNIMAFDRTANFSQSQESIDRQTRLSMDKAVAERSVGGGIGQGGRGTLYPTILLQTAFDARMPTDYSDAQIAGLHDRGHICISSFDHAASGDLSVVTTWAVKWPVPEGDALIGSVMGVGISERRPGSRLTTSLLAQMALDEVDRFGSRYVIVDGTSEGGQLVFREVREAFPEGTIECSFNKREAGKVAKNKEFGLQALQRHLGWGLDVEDSEGWLEGGWPDAPRYSFGIYRMPFEGRWLKLHRELAVLKRDDQGQRQDRAMTVVQLAWYLDKHVGAVRSVATPFSIVGRKKRPRRRRGREQMIVR